VVVCPVITLSVLKTHIWRPFIPTAKILSAVDGRAGSGSLVR
jgi:hypothetical protein